jgi:hypothetical protein
MTRQKKNIGNKRRGKKQLHIVDNKAGTRIKRRLVKKDASG